ncbi:PP2C family protein-serine/threonine phosphatase [Streptomyces sp. NPDC050560]|uniref:PP2C family protein-serine/threonine phosphatase n=1 Tax=Streptomyces sp. NPDC050560 TaxID=3365630 RepID=UPI0037AB7CD4
MLGDLLAASHIMPLEYLPVQAAESAAHAGFCEADIYLADLQGLTLRLMPGDDGRHPRREQEEIPVDSTAPGRAFQYGHIVDAKAPDADGYHWWVPLVDGTARLGLLRLCSAHDDARAREDADRLAALLAVVIVSKTHGSDSLARLTRSRPMNVAAEMQWQLTNPRSYADGRVVIAASTEPAYQVSGDAFDYGTDGPLIHLSIFDAMGHDTAAGLTAHLALGACRNARRQGASLLEAGEAVEEALIEQYDYRRYATGILSSLDTRTGELTWVNRGHPPPLVIRGSRWSTHLTCKPMHPMGTGLGIEHPACTEQLEPGDRVVFYTDGITEARNSEDTVFGLERFLDFLVRRHADRLPVPETLRRLTRTILDHHDGHLQDDATILLCEWLGPSPAPSTRAAALAGVPDPHATALPGDGTPIFSSEERSTRP